MKRLIPLLCAALLASPAAAQPGPAPYSAGAGIAITANTIASTITQYTNGQASAAAPVQSVNGNTGAVVLTTTPGATQTFSAKAVDLHTATGDVATIAIPAAITKYAVQSVVITNCSTTPILAQVAIYTAAAGAGINVVAAGTITGASSATAMVNPTVTASSTALTASTLYVRVPVANALALTCDVFVVANNLS